MAVAGERTVVIVTMARSGSSLLAGILHRLGVAMGPERDLAMGRHLNRLGCHEDQAFQRISLNILLEAGLLLDLTRRLAVDEDRLARAVHRHRPRLERYLAERSSSLWGFKDPGLVYALPHIHPWLENPLYIHLKRDVAATARSLYRTFRPPYWLPELREKLPLFTLVNRGRLLLEAGALLLARQGRYHDLAFFEEVVAQGHARAGAFLERHRSLAVQLEHLIADPRGAVAAILDFVGHAAPEPARRAALDFVRPEMLHHTRAAGRSRSAARMGPDSTRRGSGSSHRGV